MHSLRCFTLMLLVLITSLFGTAAFNKAEASTRVADPAIWGVYAKLVGTEWVGDKRGVRSYRWGNGDEIVEEDSGYGRSTITPGDTRGSLKLRLSVYTFHGKVENIDSIVWSRDAMIKAPYRISLKDGKLFDEGVRLEGNQVVGVKYTLGFQKKNVAAVAVTTSTKSANAKTGAFSADPKVWGVYAGLPNEIWQAAADEYQLKWEWKKPGEELLENWINPATGVVAYTNTIMPGGMPGQLRLVTTYMGAKEWLGTVAEDGSVLFVGKGMLKLPYQTALNNKGEFELKTVKLSGDKIVSIENAFTYRRMEAPRDTNSGSNANLASHSRSGNGTAHLPVAQSINQAPRTADELEALSNELKKQAVVQRQIEANAARENKAKAEQTATNNAKQVLEQQLADATAGLRIAEQKARQARNDLDNALAIRSSANPVAVKPGKGKGGDHRDWWTYCSYELVPLNGARYSFLSNLVHQRMYHPYEGPQAEYAAYTGPNKVDEVQKRFQYAMESSGLVPNVVGGRYVTCKSFGALDSAMWKYKPLQKAGFIPVQWQRLEDTSLSTGKRVPTPDELAELKGRAAVADRQVAEANAKIKLLKQQQQLQQQRDAREAACTEKPGFRKVYGLIQKTRVIAMDSLMDTPHSASFVNIACTQPPNPGATLKGWWKCTAEAPTGLMVKTCPNSGPKSTSKQ